MSIDDLKQEIAQRTGVPVILLTGETAEENIAQAKAFLAYKREYEQQRPKSNSEKFEKWAAAELGEEEPQDTASAALAEIEEAVRLDAGGFPRVTDGGEVMGLADARPARDQFAEWIGQKTAFNPFKDGNSWA